jgi:uncharacterized protein (TIGR02246 family)
MIAAMLVPVAVVATAPAPEARAQAAILAAMADSAAGWSAGDLDRFMRVYADDAVYVTTKGLVRGKAAIAARYAASFTPGGNARGRLTFGDTSFRPIDARHVLMWARWSLTAAAGKVDTGMTTLLFERRPQGWRIISDHSS